MWFRVGWLCALVGRKHIKTAHGAAHGTEHGAAHGTGGQHMGQNMGQHVYLEIRTMYHLEFRSTRFYGRHTRIT